MRQVICCKTGSHRRLNGDLLGQNSILFLYSFPSLCSVLPTLPPVLLSFLFKECIHVAYIYLCIHTYINIYILHYIYNTYIYICMCLVGQPMDCSPPGSSVHGIIQGRILEWAAMSFSRGIFLTQESNSSLFCLLNGQET